MSTREAREKRSHAFKPCSRAGCRADFVPTRRGSEQKYCSASCRKQAWEDRRQRRARLTALRQARSVLDEMIHELEE